jgi:DNA-binding SARP family transcriptional activator
MSLLHISLFGRFTVDHHGRPFAAGLEARKVQELISYLLLYRGRCHPRESLAELLWGESSGPQSRKYLRQALWQLQSALKADDGANDGDVLIVDSEWVGISDGADIWLDVAEFEGAYAEVQGKPGHELAPEVADRLAEAVKVYSGSLLESWYHDWCIFERERLQNIYLAMLNKLMVYSEATQQFETGLMYGQRILRCDRAHERTHRRMMMLHYLAGDRTAALRQYERCVAALDEELGVPSSKWTMNLYERIRADTVEVGALDASSASAEASIHAGDAAQEPVHLGRLQALLVEVQREVQQYVQTVGAVTVETQEADL